LPMTTVTPRPKPNQLPPRGGNHAVVDMSTTLPTSNTAASSARLKINGELVILGVDGRLSFDALQQRLVTSPANARNLVATVPASYVAFDLPAIGGVDLRTQRWTVRRRRLEQLAAAWALPLQVSPVTDDLEEAQEWFDVLPEAMGVEGLVVKGASSRYVGGRRDWLKIRSVGVAVFDELTRGDMRPGQQWFAGSSTVSDTCRTRCG
jgi:ATP-dependent DNA ligase